jgi:hypothetical protein
MKQDIEFNTISILDPVESFQSKQSQLDPIDYNLLVNKPDSFLYYYSKWDGSDWDVINSGTVALTRDMYYNNLTIPVSTTIITSWYSICVKWTLLNQWTISYNWNNWSNASLYTWWAWWAALATWTIWVNYWGKTWWNGGIWPSTPHQDWVAWDSSNPSYSNVNAVAWASGWDFLWGLLNNWWAAWTATRWVNYNSYLNIAQALSQFSMPTRVYNTMYNWSPSSWWAGWWQHNWNLTAGGGWGGWGGNWWILVIHCYNYYWSWTIQSKGWTWWNGANWQNNWWWPGAWWGGWGAGWTGGIIFFTYTIGNAPTTDVTGWSWGNPGANTWFSWALATGWSTWANWVAILINK